LDASKRCRKVSKASGPSGAYSSFPSLVRGSSSGVSTTTSKKDWKKTNPNTGKMEAEIPRPTTWDGENKRY